MFNCIYVLLRMVVADGSLSRSQSRPKIPMKTEHRNRGARSRDNLAPQQKQIGCAHDGTLLSNKARIMMPKPALPNPNDEAVSGNNQPGRARGMVPYLRRDGWGEGEKNKGGNGKKNYKPHLFAISPPLPTAPQPRSDGGRLSNHALPEN